jgi:hypothetical protein
MNEHRNKNSLEQLYNEMLYYIDSYTVNGETYDAFTISDLDSHFDNSMDVKDFDSCSEQFSNMRFQFIPEVTTTCEKCNEQTTILVDYIEEIL